MVWPPRLLASAMLDFQITVQANELLCDNYHKMGLISKTLFRKFVQRFEAKTA